MAFETVYFLTSKKFAGLHSTRHVDRVTDTSALLKREESMKNVLFRSPFPTTLG